MSFASPRQAAPARPSRRAPWRRGVLAVLLALSVGATVLSSVVAAHEQAEAPAPQEHASAPAATPQEHGAPAAAAGQAHGAAAAGEHGAAGEEAHEEGLLPLVARLFNFAVLAGVLVYFARTPLASYLASRHTEIREELVKAAETRAAATAQLAAVEQKVQALPAELDALRAQGAEDVVAERERIRRPRPPNASGCWPTPAAKSTCSCDWPSAHCSSTARSSRSTSRRPESSTPLPPKMKLRMVDWYAAELKGAQ